MTAENSGISADNTYTHAISGGAAESVNGVDFELLNVSILQPTLGMFLLLRINSTITTVVGTQVPVALLTLGYKAFLVHSPSTMMVRLDQIRPSHSADSQRGRTTSSHSSHVSGTIAHRSSRSLTLLRMVKLHQSRLARIILSLS